jgi:lysozyme
MPTPADPEKIVLDLSHWQGTPDFKKIFANGTEGVILKCTQGTSYVDDKYLTNMQAAKSAGLLVSAYHFLERGDIDAQMGNFLKTHELPYGSRLCLDFEENPNGGNPTLTDLTDAVLNLMAYAPDYEITVYGSGLLKSAVGSTRNEILADCTSLWIAHYTSAKAPDWPKQTWPQWSLWQYTQSGSSPGVSGDVDCNRWNGDPARLADWFYAPQSPPEPTPPPVPDGEAVSVSISVPEGTKVTIFVNGNELSA